MIDLLDATEVEFYVDNTGKCWLNVDGKCLVRIGHAKKIYTEDVIDDSRCVHEDEKGYIHGP